MGLSFSIPIETASGAVRQLRENGKVSRGLLGVQVGAVNREMAEAFGLERPVGALVNDVTEGSAAERAGIQPGDVILAFNDDAIESSGDLPPLVGANPPGTEAEVMVSRNGKQKTFVVTLDALESDEDGNLLASSPENGQSNALGIMVEAIHEDRRRALGNPEGGVIISRIESDAAFRAGLRTGDVILTINNETVEDAESFERVAQSLPEGKAVALRVMREGVTRYIAYSPVTEE
jgi:serine protease Do